MIILRSSAKTAYVAYGILPNRSLFKLRNFCLVYRLQHSDVVVFMPKNACSMSALSGRSTRGLQANKLCLVKAKKKANKLCYLVKAVIHFNDLLTSFNQFKNLVIKILLKD